MKIKLDENLSRHLKAPLLALGHEVSTALEESLLGKVDTEVGAANQGKPGRSLHVIGAVIFIGFSKPRSALDFVCSTT